MIEKMPVWLRWVILVPASLITYVLVSFALSILVHLSDFLWSEGSENWSRLIRSIACPFYMVIAAAHIAPRGKLATAISLSAAHAVAYALFIGYMVAKAGDNFHFSGKLIWVFVLIVAGILATAYACVNVYHNEVKAKQESETTKAMLENTMAKSSPPNN